MSSQGVDPFEVFDTFFGGSNGIFGGMGESDDFNFNFGSHHGQDLDIRYDLFLSFEESIFGVDKDIEVSLLETCDTCNGTGAKSNSSFQLCSMCQGRGSVVNSQKTPFGIMSQVSKCSKCGGDGKIVTDFCQRCGGKGKVKSKRTIKVVIPPGVSNQATMKVRGEGNLDIRRGIAGDLFLVFHVDEKRGISREGLNLYSKVEIDYTEAILGTEIKVETVEGLRDLQIPPGIQPGDTVKMLNMGVPNVKKPSMRGNHHFVVGVRIPKEISDEEHLLVRKLALLRSSSNHYSDPFRGVFDNKKFNHVSSHGNESASSLWNQIKDFFRPRQSGQRFATVGVSSPLLHYSRPNHMLMISVSLAFAMAIIISLTKKISFVYQQKQLKQGSCSDKRTERSDLMAGL